LFTNVAKLLQKVCFISAAVNDDLRLTGGLRLTGIAFSGTEEFIMSASFDAQHDAQSHARISELMMPTAAAEVFEVTGPVQR
jgi:hypothetical protein